MRTARAANVLRAALFNKQIRTSAAGDGASFRLRIPHAESIRNYVGLQVQHNNIADSACPTLRSIVRLARGRGKLKVFDRAQASLSLTQFIAALSQSFARPWSRDLFACSERELILHDCFHQRDLSLGPPPTI
ncbi:unnamed protein product [Cercospora beticola]|nr:unnamed protein product [Cercospora beticola]